MLRRPRYYIIAISASEADKNEATILSKTVSRSGRIDIHTETGVSRQLAA